MCLSARVDPLNDTVQSIDCSYKADGWQIEDVQIVRDYWKNDRESELSDRSSLHFNISKLLRPDMIRLIF